jgi:hypothetical protein
MPELSFLTAFADNPLTLSIVTIGGIIVVFIWKVGPMLKDIVGKLEDGNKEHNVLSTKIEQIITSDKEQSSKIEDLKLHVRNNILDTLRLTVYDTKIDIQDRLVAARRYFLLDGNGKVAAHVNVLIKENPEIWKTVLLMSKDSEREKLISILGKEIEL